MSTSTENDFYVGNIPEAEPMVDNSLLRFLGDEVRRYHKTVTGTKCLLCPFRKFRSPSRLKKHINNHRKKYMFLAAGKSKQLAV